MITFSVGDGGQPRPDPALAPGGPPSSPSGPLVHSTPAASQSAHRAELPNCQPSQGKGLGGPLRRWSNAGQQQAVLGHVTRRGDYGQQDVCEYGNR